MQMNADKLENLVQAFELCVERDTVRCAECPYKESYCLDRIKKDTLSVLQTIVLCKDCKFYIQSNEGRMFCMKGGVIYAKDDDFCSMGEKRI